MKKSARDVEPERRGSQYWCGVKEAGYQTKAQKLLRLIRKYLTYLWLWEECPLLEDRGLGVGV
jgi:hypothetical protein